MAIYIENLQDKMEIDEKIIVLIEQCMKKVLENEGMTMPCEISVLLVDNDKIREMNKQYRKVDSATDVLSFPMVEMNEGKVLSSVGDFDLDQNSLVLGDIVISVEKALQQANEYGHSLEREIGFLSTHGLLHLLGYDHETPKQEELMRSRQEHVLEELKLFR